MCQVLLFEPQHHRQTGCQQCPVGRNNNRRSQGVGAKVVRPESQTYASCTPPPPPLYRPPTPPMLAPELSDARQPEHSRKHCVTTIERQRQVSQQAIIPDHMGCRPTAWYTAQHSVPTFCGVACFVPARLDRCLLVLPSCALDIKAG